MSPGDTTILALSEQLGSLPKAWPKSSTVCGEVPLRGRRLASSAGPSPDWHIQRRAAPARPLALFFQGKGTSSGGKPPPPQRRTHAPRLFRCKAIPLIEMFVKPAWSTGPGRDKAAPSGSIRPILPVVVPVVYRSSRRLSGRFALKPGSDAAQRRRIGAPGLKWRA